MPETTPNAHPDAAPRSVKFTETGLGDWFTGNRITGWTKKHEARETHKKGLRQQLFASENSEPGGEK